MTDTLITEVQQGIIDQIVSSALDVIIWDYLNNPDNGFMVQEEIETITVDASCTVVFFPDTSTTDCIFLDSTTVTWIDTTSSLTVEEWKDIYLEGTYNDAMKTQEKIAFLDSNSPNYPLTDYEHILFNFDTEDSLNYPMSPDTTGDIYIEYTYPTAVKIDGMFFQGGEDGAQFYGGDSNASVILAGYISYSKNGEDWEYLKNEANMVAGDTVAIAATDADDAASSPFIFDDSTGFINSEITNIVFDEVALEAQYWRFHIVDIEAYLTAIGKEAGYTGYTAAVSHLRFQQFKLDGSLVITQTLPGDAVTTGTLPGDAIQDGGLDTPQYGDGTITEEKLADFAITPVKLGVGVGGKLDISRSGTSVASGFFDIGATFTFDNDDGYLPITCMFHFASDSTPRLADDGFRIRVMQANGSYTTLYTFYYISRGGITLLLRNSLPYAELKRDPGDTARHFKMQAYHGTTSKTLSVSIEGTAIFAY